MKKAITLLLVLSMLLCFIPTAIASATETPTCVVNEETTLTLDTGVISNENVEGNVKNIGVNATLPTSVATYTILETATDEGSVQVTVKCTTTGTANVQYEKYHGSEWETKFFTFEAVLPSAMLDGTTTFKTIDQNYTLEVAENYVDTTKVKLEWDIQDMNVSYVKSKVWNPDLMQWDDVVSTPTVTAPTADFTLTNYSSVKIAGTVTFAPETSLADSYDAGQSIFENNGDTVDSMVNADRTVDSMKRETPPSNTVRVSLGFDNDAFKTYATTVTAEKYGTYTVTIEKKTPTAN